MDTKKEKSGLEELRSQKIEESNVQFNEPEITSFELSDVFEEEKKETRRVFGKRSSRQASEIKIKKNIEVQQNEEDVPDFSMPKEEVVEDDVKEAISPEDIAPALLEVKPEILDSLQPDEPESYEMEISMESKDSEDSKPYAMDEEEEEDGDIFYEKKRFLASQYEKAEAYLESQSMEGYHFIRKKGKKFYFREGDPKHYYYSYCYFQFDPDKDAWREWEKEGWKLVGRASGKTDIEAGWYIFRNVLEIGEYKKTIDNEEEKFRLFKRLNNSYRSTVFLFFVIMCVCGVTAYLQYQFHGFLVTLIACIAIFFVSFIFFIIYSRYLWNSRRVSSKLKTTLRLKEKDAFIKTQNVPDYSESEEQLNAEWDSLEKEEKEEE